jgi:spore germination protein YaaH
VHLVVAEVTNQALTHFCLDPALPLRGELIDDIVKAAEPFDGVQIDFELVPLRDKPHFISFLSALRGRLGGKPLSVALPARVRNVDDAFDYAAIARVADRVIVMAYDEHWSGSAPGSIASLEWCKKVSAYASSVIGRDKLVMGIPFYGRAWGEATLSKAYRFSSLSRLIEERGVTEIARSEGIPSFEYTQPVRVRVFYEDANSILLRARLYQGSSVRNISFWRLGQEDPAVWGSLSVTSAQVSATQ